MHDNDSNRLLTRGVIAETLGVHRWQVDYVIQKLGIGPIGWAGVVRVFDREALEQIATAMKASKTKHGGQA